LARSDVTQLGSAAKGKTKKKREIRRLFAGSRAAAVILLRTHKCITVPSQAQRQTARGPPLRKHILFALGY